MKMKTEKIWRYKIGKRDSWTNWTITNWAPRSEEGTSFQPSGVVALSREEGERGLIRFVLDGVLYDYEVVPCPTRAGLVRIACRLVRKEMEAEKGEV